MEFGAIVPDEGVISQHFCQLYIERPVEISKDLLSDGKHGTQVFVCRPPGV